VGDLGVSTTAAGKSVAATGSAVRLSAATTAADDLDRVVERVPVFRDLPARTRGYDYDPVWHRCSACSDLLTEERTRSTLQNSTDFLSAERPIALLPLFPALIDRWPLPCVV